MGNAVFMSYSSKEYEIAEQIRSRIAAEGITTWMAPASIEGGKSYAEQIPRAIRGCEVFVLVFSQNAMSSIWVSREVDRALNEGKRILPFAIENVPLTDEYNFYLTNVQRYPAYQNFERELERMVRDIRLALGMAPSASDEPNAPAPEKPAPAFPLPKEPAPAVQAQPEPASAKKPPKAQKRPKTASGQPNKKCKLLPLLLGLGAAALLGLVLFFALGRGARKSGPTVTIAGQAVEQTAWRLALSEVELTQEDVNVIAEMPNLTSISIKNSAVTAADLSPLVREGLATLELGNCDLTAAQIASLPLAQSNIATLDLSGSDVEDIAPLLGAEKLRSLSLNDTAVADLSPLLGNGRISTLELSRTGVRDLSSLAECMNLTHLSVQGNGLTTLHGLEKAIRLSYLNAADNEITSLEGIENATVLSAVDLSRNRLTNVDILAKSAAKLTTLLLSDNELTVFVPAAAFPELRRLNVSGNDLVSLGTASFPQLQHLSVSGNPRFGELPALTEQLHCLYAAGCSLTEVGNCFAAASYPGTLDLRGDPVTRIVFASGRYGEIILTGAPLTDDLLQGLRGAQSFTLFLDYREGMDFGALSGVAYTCYIVGCPLDEQVAAKNALRTAVFLDEDSDADAYIKAIESSLWSLDATGQAALQPASTTSAAEQATAPSSAADKPGSTPVPTKEGEAAVPSTGWRTGTCTALRSRSLIHMPRSR